MKSAAFNVVVFGVLTVIVGREYPWALPGLLAITASRVVMFGVVTGRTSRERLGSSLLANVVLIYVGAVYLVSLVGGTPLTWTFWLIFVAFLLPFGLILSAARTFRTKRTDDH